MTLCVTMCGACCGPSTCSSGSSAMLCATTSTSTRQCSRHRSPHHTHPVCSCGGLGCGCCRALTGISGCYAGRHPPRILLDLTAQVRSEQLLKSNITLENVCAKSPGLPIIKDDSLKTRLCIHVLLCLRHHPQAGANHDG